MLWGEGAPESLDQTSPDPLVGHYRAAFLSAPEMLLFWPEIRNGPEVHCCSNNNAGIFFCSPILCFQPEIAPEAIHGLVLGALAKASWSLGFSLALRLTVPDSQTPSKHPEPASSLMVRYSLPSPDLELSDPEVFLPADPHADSLLRCPTHENPPDQCFTRVFQPVECFMKLPKSLVQD